MGCWYLRHGLLGASSTKRLPLVLSDRQPESVYRLESFAGNADGMAVLRGVWASQSYRVFKEGDLRDFGMV